MKVFYFDTSALVKHYHVEKGSEQVSQILGESNNIIVIASITISEAISTFAKKFRQNKITKESMDDAISEFSKDVVSKYWVIEISRYLINVSKDIILKHGLKALDSIQLAGLIKIRNAKPKFVCSDKKLLISAEKEGIEIINPENSN